MAIQSTDTTELFITRAPAWEDGVSLDQAMASDVFAARSGYEQRQARRKRGMWTIGYKAYLNRAERTAREERALNEVRARCWVPFWTETSTTVGVIMAANFVTIDRFPTTDFFVPGHWIYFAGSVPQFRQIAATAGNGITLEPTGAPIIYALGTTLYPVLPCVRRSGQADFRQSSEATYIEKLVYSTL